MPKKRVIELGDKCADKVSGLVGTVTGVAAYLYGGDTHCRLTADLRSDGKVHEEWFESGRLRKIPQPKK